MNPIVEKEDKEKRRTMARRDRSMAALKAKRKPESSPKEAMDFSFLGDDIE
ncbi:hypothetical protein IWQ61_006283 [Dispira simplex]|nr:hypothetical protein IWQ61_006283 [Dispira simplex]